MYLSLHPHLLIGNNERQQRDGFACSWWHLQDAMTLNEYKQDFNVKVNPIMTPTLTLRLKLTLIPNLEPNPKTNTKPNPTS